MKTDRAKQILAAAAKLPPAKGRALLEAVRDSIAAKDAADPDFKDLRAALADDMRPLGDALWNAYQAGDLAATLAGLKKVSKRMPELVSATNLQALLGEKLAAAWIGGES